MDIAALVADPSRVLLPLVWGLGALLLLLLIYRLLRRYPPMREISLFYVAGTLLLGVTLVLDGEGLLAPGWLRSLLLASILICWGYVIFDLLEDLLIERSLRRRSITIPRLARDIFRGLALVAMVLLALNWIFGVPLSSIVISSTVASAVIGLALQDLLKNVIAGLALQAERPFRPGDWVLINGQTSKIVEMSWRATRMVTVDNTHIMLPNATLAQAQIDNYSIVSPLQALHVQVALGYQHPPNVVKEVLVRAALAAEGVVSDPPPGVRLVAYGEYSVTYDIKFWMHGFDKYVETRDAVMTNIWYFVRRANLRLPFPIRDIYVHQADSSRAADEHRQQVGQIMATLANVEIFRFLDPAELRALAEHVEPRLYGRGEVLVSQGATDDALFVIRRGQVRVEVFDAARQSALMVSRLTTGDFFGELALLTGAPRGATVIAEEDTEALVVHRDALGPLLERNPALPALLSEALERRAAQTQSALAEIALPVSNNGAELSQPNLLQRIQALFGLD